jgi:autotransporter-associated beta strand protein
MLSFNAVYPVAGTGRGGVLWGPVLADLRRGALIGVSTLALAAGLAVADGRSARAADDRIVVDGEAGSGYIVRGNADGTFFGLDQLQSGTVIEDRIYTNFVTKGGDGSGGGAGLGGVFFVDAGSSLTIRNVDFNTNTAVGGNGGNDPGVSTGARSVALSGNQTAVIDIGGLIVDPGLTGAGNATTVTSIQLSAPNSLLKAGMKVFIPGLTPTGSPAEILSVSGSTVTFADPLPVTPVSLTSLASPSEPLTTRQIQLSGADLGEPQAPVIQVGSYIRGDGIPAGTTVSSIDYATGVVTLSSEITSSAATAFDFVSIGEFSASPLTGFSDDGTSTTITMADRPSGALEVGMTVTGNGIPAGAKITAVSPDGKSVTIDKVVPPGTSLTAFDAATISAAIGSDTIVLPRANGELKAGMLVSGTGIPAGTVIESVTTTTVDGREVTTVVLDQQLTGDTVPASLSFTGVQGVTGSTISFVAGTMPEGIAPGQVITGPGIQAGVTVLSVDTQTGEVVLSAAIDDPSVVSSLKFSSPLASGGTMNGMTSPASGQDGMTGASSDINYAIGNGGEGGDGKQGEQGGNGSGVGQAGGAGGDGGNAGDALPYHPQLTAEVTIGAIMAIRKKMHISAALTPKGVPVAVPDPIKAAVDASELSAMYVQLAKDTANLVAWNLSLQSGGVAQGGDGGDGGKGGNGTQFFGGGAGGDGGNGGAGGISASTGGSGGEGGAGGNGGFGAGGGAGGAGGDAGSGMYAPDGTAGAGGRGGFGAGDGADGDGLFGGGGSGFGGAIFVRNGGNLTIEGTTTFADNDAMGGNGGDRGEAGADAGSDLFVMKGATVTLRPGAGETITFNGSIADDSKASFDGASNGTGNGADITIEGPGLVVFNGTNTYTGRTIITGGALDADVGTGIHEKSNITFAGAGETVAGTSDLSEAGAGVLLTSGDFNRQVGTLSNRVQWVGSGGFAAQGGQLRVNLGGTSQPQTLAWGATNGFFSHADAANAALVFGSIHADADVLFRNNIDLNGGSRQVVVVDNTDSEADFATIAGVISDSVGGGKLVVGSPNGYGGTGQLVLTGDNTYTGGTEVHSGILVTLAGKPGQAGVLADTGDITVGEDGNLWLMADDTVGGITNAGAVLIGADIVAGAIDNDGMLVLDGKLTAASFANDGVLSFEGGSLSLSGQFTGGTGSSVTIGEDTTLVTAGLAGDGTITLSDDAVLTIEQSGASVYAGIIAGAGGVTLAGADADLTLTGTSTYTGKTVVEDDARLALSGTGGIADSSEVQVDGTFDIAGTTDGAAITTLSGSGSVVLGAETLTISDGSTTFAGSIAGTGGLAIAAGTQALTGENTYEGATSIAVDATLALADAGSIADSSGVEVRGTFDLGEAAGPVTIRRLTGAETGAAVKLGANELSITDAAGAFAGVVSGDGGALTIAGGSQTLAGSNTYTGLTTVVAGATLVLDGAGDIADSSGLVLDGTFDISAADGNRSLNGLAGSDADARIILGANSLAFDGTDDGASFAGAIEGSGGIELAEGAQTLTGDSSYTGKTGVGAGATLALAGAGDISDSSGLGLGDGATFDIAGLTAGTARVATLESANGTVALGGKSLEITAGTELTSFKGSITGDGSGNVIVSGQQAFVDTTLSGGLVARDGGSIDFTGGSITALADSGSHSALRVENGGDINLLGTVMSAVGPDITAYFDTADRVANITIGTGAYFVANADDTLLLVERIDGGSNGVVNLVIDNGGLGTDRTIAGNIIDDPALLTGNGRTNVTVAEGSAWSGKTDAASFTVAAGGSAFFAEGSKINGNLTMEAGAVVNGETASEALEVLGDGVFENGLLNGNIYIHGNVSLGGTMNPGHSPGYLDIGGNFDVAGPGSVSPGPGGADEGFGVTGARAKLEVAFGFADPAAAIDFDQINVGGDLTGGMLPVELVSLSDRSVALGNLDAIQLVRVGGTVEAGAGLEQVSRVTQNGREVRIAAPRTVTATGTTVVGTGQSEEAFFGPGDVTVYSLEAFLQDETYALAALTGLAHNAGVVTLGTFNDRLGATRKDGVWFRSGGAYAAIDDTVSSTQTLGFAQGGIDVVATDMFRLGVLASYGSASGSVETELGDADLSGSTWNAGVEASFSAGGFYANAVGQYGGGDWTVVPVEAAGATTVSGMTALAALEAGFTMGSEMGSITPWGQLVYQMTDYGDVESAWVDSIDFATSDSLLVRGGVRVEADFGGIKPYANLAIAADLNDHKTVIVDGFEHGTGTGGPRVEVGGGFATSFGENITLSTDVSGTQGIGDAGFTSYQGQVGVTGRW